MAGLDGRPTGAVPDAGRAELMLLWKLAWRNLLRHRGRTLILGSAITLSYGLLLVSMGIGDDSHQQMLDRAIEGAGGQVLIHGEGFWDQRTSDLVIDSARVLLARAAAVPGVRAALPRVLVSGLLSTADGNRPVELMGVDPDLERLLKDPAEEVVAGRDLDSSPVRSPLLVGVPVAEELEITPGDRVVLTASGPDGELTRALFHLAGIVRSGQPGLDEGVAHTTVGAARSALGMGDQLHQVGVLLDAGAEAEVVAGRLRAVLEAHPDHLEVLTWREALPEMVGFIEIDDAFLYIYVVVIYLVVVLAITNTFLVAVMERVRELGLLNALGLRGGGIARLLLAETVFLTLLSMGVGFVLGYGGHLAISHWGISVASYGLEEIQISGVDLSDLVFYSTITPSRWIFASVLVAAATVASAVYPAWKASRLAPSEAMRFFE